MLREPLSSTIAISRKKRGQKRREDGFRPRGSSCKDENGNLVKYLKGLLRSWRKHYSTQGDINTITAFRNYVPNPIDDGGVKLPPHNHEEVKVAIIRLKNNKVVGPDELPVELFMTGSSELGGRTHQLIYKIFRLSDPLSCDLFKFVMESIVRKARVHRNDTIF